LNHLKSAWCNATPEKGKTRPGASVAQPEFTALKVPLGVRGDQLGTLWNLLSTIVLYTKGYEISMKPGVGVHILRDGNIVAEAVCVGNFFRF